MNSYWPELGHMTTPNLKVNILAGHIVALSTV